MLTLIAGSFFSEFCESIKKIKSIKKSQIKLKPPYCRPQLPVLTSSAVGSTATASCREEDACNYWRPFVLVEDNIGGTYWALPQKEDNRSSAIVGVGVLPQHRRSQSLFGRGAPWEVLSPSPSLARRGREV